MLSLNFLILLALIYLLVCTGLLYWVNKCFNKMVQVPIYRLVLISFAFTIFFSISFAVGRIGIPIPTFFAICGVIYDFFVVITSTCIPSSDGCMYPTPDGSIVIFVPFLLQWILWLLTIALFKKLFIRAERSHLIPIPKINNLS